MPLFGSLMVTLFGGFFTQLATLFGTRVAVGIAAVASIATLNVAFIASMYALVNGILPALPGGDYLSLAAYLFVPSNAPACLAAVFTCDGACALWRWKTDNVKVMAGVR